MSEPVVLSPSQHAKGSTFKRVSLALALGVWHSLGLAALLYLWMSWQPEWSFYPASRLIVLLCLLAFACLTTVAVMIFKALKWPEQPVLTRQLKTSGLICLLALLATVGVNLQQARQLASLQQALNQETAAYLHTPYQRPVLRGAVQATPGGEAYQKLFAKEAPAELQNDSQKARELISWREVNGQKTFNWNPDAQIVAKHRPLITLARQATQAEKISYQPPELNWLTPLPNYISAQNLSKVMLTDALLNMQQGQVQAGFEEVFDSLRMGQDIGHQGPLIQSMVGIVISNQALDVYFYSLEQLYRPGVNPATLHAELDNLLTHSPGMVKNGLKSEALMSFSFLLNDLNIDALQEFALDNQPKLPFTRLLRPVLHPYVLYSYQLGKDFFQASVEQQPATEWHQFSPITLISAEMQDRIEQNLFWAILIPNFSGAYEREQILQMRLLNAYLQVSLARYYQQHQRFPADLHELETVGQHYPLQAFSKATQLTYQPNSTGYSIKLRMPKTPKDLHFTVKLPS